MTNIEDLLRRAIYGDSPISPAPVPPPPAPEPPPEDRSSLFAAAIFGAAGADASQSEARSAALRRRGPTLVLGRPAGDELSIPAAARELGIPAAAVRAKVDSGSLRSVRRGSRDCVRWGDLVAYSRLTA